MNAADTIVQERQILTIRLLDAVKQCQVRFGGRTELATDGDARVSCLCAQFEAALQHGMRKNNKGLSAIKQVTGMVNVLSSKNTEAKPAFWQFVKEHLNKHEFQRYMLLKNIATDIGRGRAWLRSALNEHSLERYILMLLSDINLISQYYEDKAFLLDQERSSMLPMMAAGLGSILFAINIDNPELNSPQPLSVSLSPSPPPTILAYSEPRNLTGMSDVSITEKKKKKKKKAPVHVVSFDDEDTSSSRCYSESYTSISDSHSMPNLHCSSLSESFSPSCDTSTSTHPQKQEADFNMDQNFTVNSNNINRNSPKPTSAELLPEDDTWINSNSTTLDNCQNNNLLDEYINNCVDPKLGDLIIEKDSSTQEEPIMSSSIETASPLSANIVFDLTLPPSDNSPPVNNKEQATFNEETEKENKNLFMNIKETSYSDRSLCSSKASMQKFPSMNSLLSDLSADSEEKLPAEMCIHNTQAPLTPVNDVTVKDLIPVTGHEDAISEDSNDVSVPSFSEDMENATQAIILAQKVVHSSHNLNVHENEPTALLESAIIQDQTLSIGELKQAVVALMQRKEEIEEQNRSLRHLLDCEMEMSASLRLEIDELKHKQQERQDKDFTKIQTLTRENELLKHQLKKYVAAVQMLRKEGTQGYEVLHGLQGSSQMGLPEPKHYIDYHHEASEYERKLIQVAEMHGELMEFNDRLHRQLNQKEALIRRLREELIDLRGPLPDDTQTSDDDASITSDYDTSSMTAATRALINIWIPSAFLTGRTSDVHHVYQVFVRIRDEEWNVYRRYTQFYELHRELKKKTPAVNTFDFPPKKTIGNKDAKFVEERRKRLQHYLRCVVNLMIQTNADLANNVSKQNFIAMVPFFGDIPNDRSTNKSKRKRNIGGRGGNNSTPQRHQHYTGL